MVLLYFNENCGEDFVIKFTSEIYMIGLGVLCVFKYINLKFNLV